MATLTETQNRTLEYWQNRQLDRNEQPGQNSKRRQYRQIGWQDSSHLSLGSINVIPSTGTRNDNNNRNL